MRGYIKKGIIFGIIFLFLGASVTSLVNASNLDEIKEDLSLEIDNKNSASPYGFGTFILIGFFKVKSSELGAHGEYIIGWESTFGFIFGLDEYEGIKFETIKKGTLFATMGELDYQDSIFDVYKCMVYAIY